MLAVICTYWIHWIQLDFFCVLTEIVEHWLTNRTHCKTHSKPNTLKQKQENMFKNKKKNMKFRLKEV